MAVSNLSSEVVERLDSEKVGGVFPVLAADHSTGTRLDDTISLANALETVSDAHVVKFGLLDNRLVKATVTATGGSAAATAGTLSVALVDALTGEAVTVAQVVKVYANSTSGNRYAGDSAKSGTITFGSATVGSILTSGNGWAAVKTSAAGLFTCVPSNSADETAYFSVASANGGVTAATEGCLVVESNSSAATWSA